MLQTKMKYEGLFLLSIKTTKKTDKIYAVMFFKT